MTGAATAGIPAAAGTPDRLVATTKPADVAAERRTASRHLTLLAALLTAHALLAWTVRQRGIFTFGDDASYLLLSRSLRALSYREIQFVGEPIAGRFPPGYPALLAVLGSVFGERLDVIAVAGILLSICGLVALFDVVRRRWSPGLALLVTAVVAVNPVLVSNAGATASETMFTTLALWTLWAVDRADPLGAHTPPGARKAVGSGALAIATALTRSAGVTLGLALGLHWLYRRRHRRVVILGVTGMLTVGAWLAWTVVAPRREVRRSYVDDAINVRVDSSSFGQTLIHRLATNTSTYVGQSILTELHLPVTKRTQLDNVAWVAVLGTLLLAGLWSAWRRWNIVVWYVATYSLLLAAWTWVIERFLDPIIPLVLALVLIGARVIGARVRAGWLLPVATGVVLAGCALIGDARLVERAEACDRARVECAEPASIDFVDAATYIGQHTPAGSRIIAPKAGTLYYFARRQSLFWDEVISRDTASFPVLLRDDSVSYILTTPVFSDHHTLLRLALHECATLDLVRAFSQQTLLLAVRPDRAADEDRGQACRALARALGT